MNGESRGKRAYHKRTRAARETETRRRITAAAVSLHEEVGPLRTTIAELARRAGVERPTVYRHFPDEISLLRACQAHWFSDYPLPDATAWAQMDDPEARLHRAVSEMYAYYRRGLPMLDNVFRDAPRFPALAQVLGIVVEGMDAAAAMLADAFSPPPDRRPAVVAATTLAISFDTWKTLVQVVGLPEPDAVALMTAFVAGAARSSGSRRGSRFLQRDGRGEVARRARTTGGSSAG
jgi:AcrR family transcriptional regulator